MVEDMIDTNIAYNIYVCVCEYHILIHSSTFDHIQLWFQHNFNPTQSFHEFLS